MDTGLRGRAFVVTGGSSGIGAAVARALAAEGARVFGLDRAPPTDAGVEHLEVDVADPDAVSAAVDHAATAAGRLDGAVSAAGITRDGVCWKLSLDDWRDVIRVNLDGTFHLVRAVAPRLRERGGAIVLVSSINGERGKFGQANYAASKAGVIGLAKSAARELGRFGVRVNVVAPGFIDTPMTAGLAPAVRDAATSAAPLGRAGRAEEVADAALYLCSDRASFVTGQVLRVDGGQYT